MNEAALSKKTAHGPEAATISPAKAGPIARAMLIPTPLSVIAAGKSDGETNSGVIACQTGLLIADPTPSRKVSESNRLGVIWPIKAKTPIAPAATNIQICMTRSKRRRTTRSASAPAGSATRTTGRLPAVSTSATRTGEGVNEVINHDSPTSCIQVPTLEITVAIQSARNTDPLRGLHADALLAESFPLCFLVNVSFFADFATSGATPDRSAESCAGDAHLRRASRAKCAQSPKRPPPLSFAGRLRSYWHRCAVALSARL